MMSRLLFILPLLFYFNCQAQSHLGKSKTELLALTKKAFPDAKTSFYDKADSSYIEVLNGYETLYYYLKDDICVKFVVLKPYSCNCLETDIEAYRKNCIALGNLSWLSKDYKKLYQMNLRQEYYSLSIVANSAEDAAERANIRYSERAAY